MSNFDSDPLTCDTSPNKAKKYRIFPVKEKEDRTLTLLYLDSPMAKVFSATISILFDFGHLQGKTGGQSWTKKCKFWVGVTFSINGNFQRFEKKYFCLFKYYLCWKFHQNWTIFDGVRASRPKDPQRGPFYGCWIGTKTLKFFNLTT